MLICPDHARPHFACPTCAAFQSSSEPLHTTSCISHLSLTYLHLDQLNLYPNLPGVTRMPGRDPVLLADRQAPPVMFRDRNGTARLSRRDQVQREPISVEGRHESLRNGPARRVHFDVPASSKRQNTSKPSDYIHNYSPPQKRPAAPDHPPPHALRSILTPPSLHPLCNPELRQYPTIYIITYSTELTPTSQAVNELLNTHLPHRDPPIPHLYTINASSMLVPPRHLCELYSGLSPVIQRHVLRDRCARDAVRQAVADLLDFGARQRLKRGRGGREVAMSVCCTAGTHRSVAIADVIALEVRSEVGRLGIEEGVKVVVRHAHRVKGVGDAF